MKRSHHTSLLRNAAPTIALILALGCRSVPPSDKPAPASKSPSRPATHTIQQGSLQRKVQLDAVAESTHTTTFRIAPKAYLDLTVLEAVPHGARVNKGDTLIRFDTEKLQDQILDLEKERPAATLGLEIAQAELVNAEGTTPQRLTAATRAKRIADEDLAHFDNVGKAQREKSAEMNLKGAEQRLDNALEELKQLEKMYKADDLTEETEEIVLRRQKVEVEFARFNLDNNRINTQRELKTVIPRDAEALNQNQRDQSLALNLAEATLAKALDRRRLDVEKLKRDQEKSAKRLADLKADLAATVIRAPFDGIVIHGASELGRWTTGPAVTKKLVPGGKLAPFEVFMTLADPSQTRFKAVTPEADVSKVRPGLSGDLTLTAYPDQKLKIKIDTIDSIPLITGGFETSLVLIDPAPAMLVPGLTGKAHLSDAGRPPKPLVPNEALFSEGESKFVYLADGDKHTKRPVKTGDTDGKSTEILEGLREGDQILMKKPDGP